MSLFLVSSFLALIPNAPLQQALEAPRPPAPTVDHHVHLMSPTLVRDWRATGVPFSKPDDGYGSADELLTAAAGSPPLERAWLVSMAHLYGSEWLLDLGLSVEEESARVSAENDWIARQAERHPERTLGFASVPILRPYTWDELRRCRREHPRSGLKLHLASCGVDLREAAHLAELERVLAWAEAEKRPVLLHLDTQRRGTDVEHVRAFLEGALGPHPELVITIAHLGGSGGYGVWTQRVFATVTEWLVEEATRGRPWSGLRFDLSAVVLERESEGVPATTDEEAGRLAADVRRAGLGRVLFASDYPVFEPRAYARTLAERVAFEGDELERLLTGSPP